MKLCIDCGEAPKAKGHPKWCEECRLSRQPIMVQVEAAQARLAQVPEAKRVKRKPEKEWPPGRRWCAGCQSFRRLRDCRGSRCKACSSADKHAAGIRQYGIGATEYAALYKASRGRCYLCGRTSPSRRLAVDHDHKTGIVRGLLCPDEDWGCNLKIVARFDAARDPVAMARRLVDYLADPPAPRILSRKTVVSML